jgi:hypothetical protein
MANIRNAQLLQRVQAHPLKATLAKALDIAEAFAGDVQFLQLDKNLSQEGRDNARRAKLRAAIRDLRDARAPIDEMRTRLDAKRKAVAKPELRSIPPHLTPQALADTLDALDLPLPPAVKALAASDTPYGSSGSAGASRSSLLCPCERTSLVTDAMSEKCQQQTFMYPGVAFRGNGGTH